MAKEQFFVEDESQISPCSFGTKDRSS